MKKLGQLNFLVPFVPTPLISEGTLSPQNYYGGAAHFNILVDTRGANDSDIKH